MYDISYNQANYINDFFEQVDFILLTPHGRSGSIFVQRLFDSHPEVYTLPSFLNHTCYLSYAEDLDEALYLFKINNEGLFDLFRGALDKSYACTTNVNDSKIKTISFNEFKTIFYEINALHPINSDLDFIVCIHLVFLIFYNIEFVNIKKILIHIHNYQQDFYMKNRTIRNLSGAHEFMFNSRPGTKMISLTRHPLESYYSFSVLSKDNGIDYFIKIVLQTVKCYNYLFKNMGRFSAENFFILNLGTLHQNPIQILKKLSSFLNVGYHKTMEKATIVGRDWMGVSSNNEPSNTFNSNKVLLRYRDALESFPNKHFFTLIDFLCGNVSDFFGFTRERETSLSKSRSVFKVLIDACLYDFDSTSSTERIESVDIKSSRLFTFMKKLGFKSHCSLIITKIIRAIVKNSYTIRINKSIIRLKMLCLLFFYYLENMFIIKKLKYKGGKL